MTKYKLLIAIALIISKLSVGQLCTGSLGDPVVNITFGVGNNPGPALPTTITNYTYTKDPCPQDGLYTVVSSTKGCFEDKWHTVAEDHTPGDVNGYMMLVNAAYAPGVFYVDRAKNLCAGATYEFSAWMLNMHKLTPCGGKDPIKPNITFSIEKPDGTIIKQISSGDVPTLGTPQWNKYGFFFTTTETEVVLRLINNAPGGCGNDLLLDDITFSPCGPKVNATFPNTTDNVLSFCISENKPITITGALLGGNVNTALQWQQSTNNGVTWVDIVGATSLNYTNTYAVGTYKYRLTASESASNTIINCRVASNMLTLIIDPIPIPVATNSSPGCVGQNITLTATGGRDVDTYSWTGPNGFTSSKASPIITSAALNNAGLYTVEIKTPAGCSKTATTTITLEDKGLVKASQDVSLCLGASTQLEATGGTNYIWTPATGLSNATIANPIATPAVTTTYTVKAGTTGVCTSTDVVVITVENKPNTVATNTSTGCVGGIITLIATGGSANDTYIWTGPNGFTASTASPVIPSALLSNAGEYTVEIKTAGGCSKTASTKVVINEKLIIIASEDVSICQGETAQLEASGATEYIWTPATGLSSTTINNPMAKPTNTITYTVKSRNGETCSSPGQVTVTVEKKPIVNAGPDKKIVVGESVQLNGTTGKDATTYFWTPTNFINDTKILTPVVKPAEDYTYTLHAISPNGCEQTSTVFVKVTKKIKVPNVFTPNGDGTHDTWHVEGLNTYPEAITRIYNRYGQLVFKSVGYIQEWDGKFNGSPLPFGTYYYLIDGKRDFPLMSGWVAILR